MYDIFSFIMCLATNNGITEGLISSVIFSVLEEKISKRKIDKITEYILGESLRMKKVLSRGHMISEGISEEYVDYVIEEIRMFIKKFQDKNIDEIRSQHGYENMELADFLWRMYCDLNNGEEFAEYAADLKRGLFVIAKAWNEPPEEAPVIEFIKRIDSKTSRILLGVEDVKTDTEELKKDARELKEEAKDTNRKMDEMSQKIDTAVEVLYSGNEGIHSDINKVKHYTEEMYMMMKKGYRKSSNESEKEEQTSDGQAEQNSEETDDESGALPSESTSGQEAAGTEEILKDEIKICLAAAPDEFQKEIHSLIEFIEEQNQCQNAVHLKLHCYDGETAQELQQYKYCYMLVGAKTETWMQEIYELTCGLSNNWKCVAECVQLRLFFKRLSDGETAPDDNSGREELQNRYRNDFKKIPFYFSDINRIKLDVLQNLRKEAPEIDFSTKSILQFLNNRSFVEACKERDDFQKQYEAVGKISGEDKSPEEKKEMRMLEERLREKNEAVEKMKRDIWDNLNLLTDKLQTENAMDVREMKAIEGVIEYGSYGQADIILRSEEWNQEVADLEQSMKEKKEKLRQFISAQRTLISNLKTRGISDSLENEIIEVYKRITEFSKEWHIEYITMYEFAEFLLNQRKYEEGIKIGEELKCLYGLSDCATPEEQVKLLKLLGDLYYSEKKYEKGERSYTEALDFFKNGSCRNWELRAKTYNDLSKLFWKTNQLAEAQTGLTKIAENLSVLVECEPEKYEPIMAVTYNYIGILARRRSQLDEAVDYHKKVLEIRKRLARKSSSYNFRPLMELTITYNNLAFVYKKRGEYLESEKYYKKAIDIRSRNEKINPSAFRPTLAAVYSSYATVLNLKGENEKAQIICEKAYTIRRDLVQKTPSYRVEFAYTLHEYGTILMDAGEHMYPQAKKYFEEAIQIREKLVDDDEIIYELYLAETYSCYGKLLAKIGVFPLDKQCYRKAEQNMRKACEICDNYAAKNKGYDGDIIAEIHQNFASFLNEHMEKYSEAESYYNKAIIVWKELTKQCQHVFEPKLKKAEEELAELQEKI